MRLLRSKDAHARRVRGPMCMMSSVLLYSPMIMCAYGAMLEEVAIHFVVTVSFERFVPRKIRLCYS